MRNFVAFFVVVLLSACSSNTAQAPVYDGWRLPAGARSYYIVQKGDTLYSIAWGYGVDYRDVARINHLPYPYRLSLRQHVYIAAVQFSHKRGEIRSAAKQTRYVDKLQYRRVRRWIWPAKGKISQFYSLKAKVNSGVNIAGRYGSAVVSSAAGRVVYCGFGLRGYGKLIIIKHNSSFLSAYAHNRQILVKEEQHVQAGQKIATMGRDNDGSVVLHFEIRRNGKPVNPLRYLGRR